MSKFHEGDNRMNYSQANMMPDRPSASHGPKRESEINEQLSILARLNQELNGELDTLTTRLAAVLYIEPPSPTEGEKAQEELRTPLGQALREQVLQTSRALAMVRSMLRRLEL